MERWRGRTALVTGASSGIGLATAAALASHGVNVIGCARNLERIQDLGKQLSASSKNGSVTAIKCNLNSEEDIIRMFREIEQKHKTLDMLVNNAGLAWTDSLIAGNTQKWREMIDVNVMALSICAREALRLMQQAGSQEGHIININSMYGHWVPAEKEMHFYAATKHMVTALTEGLYKEVRSETKGRMRVTSLSPGYVSTDFSNRMAGGAQAESKDPFKFLEAQDIANGILYALAAPSHVCVRELILAPTEQPA